MKIKILNKPNCIIAARGGSKRLKGKNILKINNKSLIEITINHAVKSKIFDKIIVSTDSRKIASIAKKCGAQVPFLRSKKLSGDKIGILKVVKDVLNKTDSKNKTNNIFLYPTAILLKPSDLIKSYNKFKKSNCNFLIAIKKTPSNPLKSFEIRKNKLKYKWPQNKDKQEQELKTFYSDAGSFFIFKTRNFLKYGFNEINNSFYILKQLSSVDINTEEDFNLAQIIYKSKDN